MNRYALLGIDDEVTTCDCCGKSELKCTMALSELDADGCEVAVVHFGRDCGARALGWKVAAERAEKIARGGAVRFDYDTLVRAETAARNYSGPTTIELDGVRMEVDRIFGAKRRARLLTEGWRKGPADYVWRLA